MTKPVNPYSRLLESFREYVRGVTYRHTKLMWRYPKAKLADGWNLADLAERVSAADQLGFEVIVRNGDEGLSVYYVKKIPDAPYGARA